MGKIIKPYGEEGSKHEQVEKMFDNIAPAYDRMNHLMSFGSDRKWRSRTIKALEKHRNGRILDIACGTGDMTFEINRKLSPEKLVGADLSEGMLEVARSKQARRTEGTAVDFVRCDCCEAIPFPDRSFDAVTVAFGVRNFENLEKGLKEILRVLDNGGTLAILELSVPEKCPFRQFYSLYAEKSYRQSAEWFPKTGKPMPTFPKASPPFHNGENSYPYLKTAVSETVPTDR